MFVAKVVRGEPRRMSERGRAVARLFAGQGDRFARLYRFSAPRSASACVSDSCPQIQRRTSRHRKAALLAVPLR